MSKKKKKKEAPPALGAFYTNSITDNKITSEGGVKSVNKENAVYVRETNEIIRL